MRGSESGRGLLSLEFEQSDAPLLHIEVETSGRLFMKVRMEGGGNLCLGEAVKNIKMSETNLESLLCLLAVVPPTSGEVISALVTFLSA